MRSSLIRRDGRQLLLPGFELAPVSRRFAVPVFCFCWVKSAPAPAPAPALFGSVLSLAKIPVSSCPISISLSRFQWPVRSAVLVSCLLAVRAGFCPLSPSGVAIARGFVSSALVALGFSASGCFLSYRRDAQKFLSRIAKPFVVPQCVPAFSNFSGGSLSSALQALSRCLSWLSEHAALGRGCSPALRPVVASLACELLRFC